MLEKWIGIISRGDLAEELSFIASGRDANEKLGIWNLRPLHLAAWYNQPQLIQKLIKYGAKPNLKEKQSQKTALHIAAYLGHVEACKALLENDAYIASEDESYFTPLHYASLQGHLPVVKLFVKWGAGHQYQLNSQAILTPLELAIRHENTEVIQFLLENIAYHFLTKLGDFDTDDIGRLTPIHFATLLGSTQIVQLLLNTIPSEKMVGRAEPVAYQTALHFAARDGHFEIVKLFCEFSSWIDKVDISGITSLSYAIKNGHKDVEEWLLKKGAHPQPEEKIWRDYPTKCSPLHQAVWDGNLESVIEIIHDNPETVFEKEKEGRNALQLAIRKRKQAIAKIILEAAGLELIKQKNKNGNSAVHYAALEGNIEAMEMLMGYNVSSLLYQVGGRRTPIEKAAIRNQFQMVNWISKHSDLNLYSKDFFEENTCLSWALIDHHPNVGRFFENLKGILEKAEKDTLSLKESSKVI